MSPCAHVDPAVSIVSGLASLRGGRAVQGKQGGWWSEESVRTHLSGLTGPFSGKQKCEQELRPRTTPQGQGGRLIVQAHWLERALLGDRL